jgi:hypothetical protein
VTYVEHLDVGPCGEDDTVDAKDAEDDEVLGDGIELSDKSPEPSWWSPVSAVVRGRCMRGAGKAGCVKFVNW